ncbi:MAG: hypothetical protein K8I02_07235 [Candidatus Methylomirabilis sp.]|nr:hypothetical protein [Deltaproteobacteria bacterium]
MPPERQPLATPFVIFLLVVCHALAFVQVLNNLIFHLSELGDPQRVAAYARVPIHAALALGLYKRWEWARKLQIFFFLLFMGVLLFLALPYTGKQAEAAGEAPVQMLLVLGAAFLLCFGFVRTLMSKKVREAFRAPARAA